MTEEEFDTKLWTCGLKAKYEEKQYNVVTCDFDKRLITLNLDGQMIEVSHKDCEILEKVNNVRVIKD